MLQLRAFLTAYDPSDLPGGSIDPLGFETGYLLLAEKLLPDMTNVANRPRYLSVLCTATKLTEVSPAMPPREQYLARQESIQRLERLWALANVLASEEAGYDELPAGGIRGIRYSQARFREIRDQNLKVVTHEYPLLSRQLPYGMVGIYAAVADRLRMLERSSLSLSADLGERLADAFIEETALPSAVVAAVRDEKPVRLDTLKEWGYASHVASLSGPGEAHCVRDAMFNLNPVRSRMLRVLEEVPFQEDEEEELSRMRRIVDHLDGQPENQDLQEAMRLVLEYEHAYRWVMVALERLLWLCRTLPSASISHGDLAEDPLMASIADVLPSVVGTYCTALEAGATPAFRDQLDKFVDVTAFLKQTAAACPDTYALADIILERHREVQSGKFDRGRRKMPWIHRQNGRIELTLTRTGGRDFEVQAPEDILPHFYRFEAADAFLKASNAYAHT